MTLCEDTSSREEVVGALRVLAGRKVRDCGPGRWELHVRGGVELPITLLHRNDWLQFQVPVAQGLQPGAAGTRSVWDLAEVNGRLNGAAKLAIAPAGDKVQAMRSIWLGSPGLDSDDATGQLVATMRSAVEDIREVLAVLAGRCRCNPGIAPIADPGIDLAELCQQTDWPFTRRAEGRLAVPLDIPGMTAHAIVSSGQTVRATVSTSLGESLSEDARVAVGRLLLEAGGRVGVVRGCVRSEREAVLEAAMGAKPTAVELDHALAALSVAARLCLAELPLLAGVQIAQTFIRMRGWSPRPDESTCADPVSGRE